jgi:hypothetical protein
MVRPDQKPTAPAATAAIAASKRSRCLDPRNVDE